MTDKEKLACLTDRPCQVCKYKKENGCCKWSCVFEEESESADIEKIRAEIEENKFPKWQIDTASFECAIWFSDYNKCIDGVLKIIDKHISGEGEE